MTDQELTGHNAILTYRPWRRLDFLSNSANHREEFPNSNPTPPTCLGDDLCAKTKLWEWGIPLSRNCTSYCCIPFVAIKPLSCYDCFELILVGFSYTFWQFIGFALFSPVPSIFTQKMLWGWSWGPTPHHKITNKIDFKLLYSKSYKAGARKIVIWYKM